MMAAANSNVAIAHGRDLPVATATIDKTALDDAINQALGNAVPEDIPYIEAIQEAAANLTATVDYSGPADVYVMWKTDRLTTKNQLRAALRKAADMLNSENLPEG
jgi:hypothetical protein